MDVGAGARGVGDGVGVGVGNGDGVDDGWWMGSWSESASAPVLVGDSVGTGVGRSCRWRRTQTMLATVASVTSWALASMASGTTRVLV